MSKIHLKVVLAVLISALSLGGCKGAIPSAGHAAAGRTAAAAPTDKPTAALQTDSAAAQTVSPTRSVETAPSETPVATASENPLAPEKNPPGDIPDSQVFVKYSNTAGGYGMEAPEGWARTENGTDVTFIDKFDGVQVAVTQSSVPFTVDGIKTSQAATLQNTGRAVQIKSVLERKTKNGQAILVTYESNSEPDAVTGKQVRLEDQCYFFHRDGKLAALTLWAPLGADNVDQWKLMADSFRWQ